MLLLAALLAARAWVAAINAADIATRGLLALILATTAIYATYHVRVCGGLDSYGYVSASSLIASGHLTAPQPLVTYLPFESASTAVAPLGYVAGPDGHTEVPRFPAWPPDGDGAVQDVWPDRAILRAAGHGLRDDRADFSARAGYGWEYARGIVHGGDFRGRSAVCRLQHSADERCARHVLAPGDTLAPALTSERLERTNANRRWIIDPAILAGLCAGMAFLTRPVLLGAAGIIGIVTLDRPWRETVRYGATLLVFIVVQMVINHALYGDVLLSGYGPASYMFEFSHSRLAANLANFRQSLPYSHTPVIWILWPGAGDFRRQKWAWQLSAVAAAAGFPYLFYLVFEGWESLRFLLPTIALVFILASGAVGEVVRPAKRRRPCVRARRLRFC